ncbi:MAG: hypothetical protein C0399_01170 [Syntrophus sp. (in: bacteria)]|nr:hypothetical protein [Syntrophus sp. (in: bacteria)]
MFVVNNVVQEYLSGQQDPNAAIIVSIEKDVFKVASGRKANFLRPMGNFSMGEKNRSITIQ